MSASDACNTLMERLGFPGSVRLRRVMEALMTPEQAQITVELPGTPQEVAQKTGIAPERVKEQLDVLFFRGVVFVRGDFDRREFFRFARNMTQFHDATCASAKLDVVKDRELYRLWQDFCIEERYPAVAEQVSRRQTRPAVRIVPAYRSIQGLADVLPCEDFHHLLRAQQLFAVVPCACRYRHTSVGKLCEHTNELATWHCLQFNRGAEYAVKRGSGKSLSLDEVLKLCDKVEMDGMLHIWPNSTIMTGINTGCQCCRDCCETSVAVDNAGVPVSMVWEKSRYQAYVILDDCNGCQQCVERCQFDAIEIMRVAGSRRMKAVIDAEKCFGCGLCVLDCKPEAIKMKAVRPPEYIPAAPSGVSPV